MGSCVELGVLIPMVLTVCRSEIVCVCTNVEKLGLRFINRGWGPLLKFICIIHHGPSRAPSKHFSLYRAFWASVFSVVRSREVIIAGPIF